MRCWVERSGLTGPPDVTGVVDAVADVGGVLTLRIPPSADDKPVYVAVPPASWSGSGPGTLRPGQRVSVWQAGDPPAIPPPPGGWGFREAVALLVTIEPDPPPVAGYGPPEHDPPVSHRLAVPTGPLTARLDRLLRLRTGEGHVPVGPGEPLVLGVSGV